jgi:uncharacterized protein (TIGR03435 family)
MAKLTCVGAAVLLATAAWGQNGAPLSFEVSSVKPATGQWRESKVFDNRVDFPTVTLKYCIAFAYRVKEYQVSGPPWIGESRYEIAAKAAQGTRREQLPEMMQALLAERFKMETHREKKEFNVYALIVGKSGPKLKESPTDPDAPQGAAFGTSMSGNTGVGKLEAKRSDMAALANTLTRFVGRPVVDLTGIQGRYDFELEFTREDLRGMVLGPDGSAAGPSSEFGVSIFTSLQRVGLKLEPQKLPLDTIVVDRAEKTPVEN